MTDSLDTNVLVYLLLSEDEPKRSIARKLLLGDIVIGVQVLNELTNVAKRKARLDWPAVDQLIGEVANLCDVRDLTLHVHSEGRRLAERYRLSIYDALIVAAALDAGVSRLWSEDMHDGLVVDGELTIVDPFALASR